jgi:hypothetical protein
LDEGACLTVKNIGKPCAGKPHARFDEGELVKTVKVRLMRHRQTKEADNRYALPKAVGTSSLLYRYIQYRSGISVYQ